MRKKIKLGFLVIFFIFIVGLIATLGLDSVGYEKVNNTDSLTTDQDSWQKTSGEKSQEFFYFIKNPKNKPSVGAEAYLVGDTETGEIILVKNKDKQLPIASVSKLFTALVSIDTQDQESETTISKTAIATEGQNGGLRLNEKIKVGDLIYPLLLESSNDSAEAIAEVSGRTNFIETMNKKMQDLNLKFTSFSDPSGLSEKNISTVYDLFKFAEYLKKSKPEILEISKIRSFNNKKHTWFNNSQFLGIKGYLGGKRGYIDESRQTAIASFAIPVGASGTRDVAIVVLRSPDRTKDVDNILKYINKNIYFGKESDADMDWVKQKEGVPEIKDPNFLTFVFGGDIMLDRGVRSSVNKNFNGDYSVLFEKLDILKKPDITFANFEGVASDKGVDSKNLYSFRMDPSTIPAMRGAGISILSVANNHIGDWGRTAYTDTLNRLRENEIKYTGGGLNEEEAKQPTIIEKYGIKIGFLGFSDKGPNFMQASAEQSGQLLASDPDFEEIIKNASLQVDHLIVSFHFGEEYKTIHNDRQEYLAHRAIDSGAKIVIGHHPHVVQDTEVYKNGFIAYSLGNFIFDQRFSAETMQGMLLEVKLGKAGDMTINKNIVKLNSVFQPDQVIKGKEEKIKFETIPTSQ